MAQGVAWDKDKILNEVLKPYFLLGYSVTKACRLAKIPQSTVDTWIQADDELRLLVESWQGMVSAKARSNIVEAIQGAKDKDGNTIIQPDINLSKWWLETVDRDEFKKGIELDTTSELKKVINDLLTEDTEDTEAD